MGLNETDKKELVKYKLEKARKLLAEVPSHLENEFYGTATNRLYYACFHAASALLINDGHKADTHSGVMTLLGLHYVTKNKIDASFGKMYGRLFNRRQKDDYEDWVVPNENDVKPFIEPAEQFISAIEQLISA